MSHAKHLFKGQPLCRRWPFAQPASPPAIVHSSEPPLTRSLLSPCSSEEGKEGAGRSWQLSFKQRAAVKAAGHPPGSSHSARLWSDLSRLAWAGAVGEEAPVGPTPPCPPAGWIWLLSLHRTSKPGLPRCPLALQQPMAGAHNVQPLSSSLAVFPPCLPRLA